MLNLADAVFWQSCYHVKEWSVSYSVGSFDLLQAGTEEWMEMNGNIEGIGRTTLSVPWGKDLLGHPAYSGTVLGTG
jgi:hypothetical protein